MKTVLDKLELFFLCFTVFIIPLHIKLTSVSIAFLILIALLKKENYKEFIKLYKSPKFLILIFPYIMFLLGLINTENMKEGLMQVEIVSSLILFPIIFTAYKSNSIKNIPTFIYLFLIIGVLVAYLVCLGVAIPKFIISNNFDVFFYSDFSEVIKGPHHLSYYVIFAIVILVVNLIGKLSLDTKLNNCLPIKLIVLFVLCLFLFQLSSKATILLFVLFALMLFIYVIKNKFFSYKYYLPFFIVISLFVVIGYNFPKVHIRFENFFYFFKTPTEQIDIKVQESTALRIAALKAGTNIIKNNFWFGVGNGDMANAMSEYYKNNDFQNAYIQHISPHNQFVRSFVMQGVLGFISLVLMFILMLYLAIKKKHLLLAAWTIIMFFLFNVEDILGIQDGIIFFCFFTSYFVLCPDETK